MGSQLQSDGSERGHDRRWGYKRAANSVATRCWKCSYRGYFGTDQWASESDDTEALVMHTRMIGKTATKLVEHNSMIMNARQRFVELRGVERWLASIQNSVH